MIGKKKGRGGARKKAGRKKVPISLEDMIVIGSLCERLQKEDADRAALAKYKKRPRTVKIMRVQNLVRGARWLTDSQINALWDGAALASRPDHSSPADQKATAVKGINKKGARVVILKTHRVVTRDEVCNRVSDLLMRLGRLRMTPRRVR